MDAKEGRIILLGLVVGAAAGGAAVLLMRMRGTYGEQQSAKAAVSNMSWAEVFSIGVAALSLARRVAALSQPVAEAATEN